MNRVFVWVTAVLTGIIGVLIGIIISGSGRTVEVAAPKAAVPQAAAPVELQSAAPAKASELTGAVNFADIAARINPAVVNIDATARGRRLRRPISDGQQMRPDLFDDPFDLGRQRTGETPRRGSGTGFI